MARRLFIAAPIRAYNVKREMLNVRRRLVMDGVLPTPADGFIPDAEPHITLRFLGETDDATAATLYKELDLAALGTRLIRLKLGQLETFPGVLWAAVEGSEQHMDELDELQAHVEHSVQRAGFGEADFPFKPHVTVGRFGKDYTDQYAEALAGKKYVHPVEFDVGCIEMQESVIMDYGLGPRVTYRAVYKPLLFGEVRRLVNGEDGEATK